MVAGLRYLGGKSERGTGSGRWVVSLLPDRRGYCEPFGGMLGVLLQRPKARAEMVNDLNGRLVNWWRTVRDRHEELGEWLEWTATVSREEYDWAGQHLDDPDPLIAAGALTIALNVAIRGVERWEKGNFPWAFNHRKNWNRESLRPIADRLRHVVLEKVDACDFIERVTKMRWADDMVIYLDPPYTSTPTSKYYTCNKFDKERISLLVAQHPGPVAISGYNDEWDHLGWHHTEYPTRSSQVANRAVTVARVEKLWTNYQPARLLTHNSQAPNRSIPPLNTPLPLNGSHTGSS